MPPADEDQVVARVAEVDDLLLRHLLQAAQLSREV